MCRHAILLFCYFIVDKVIMNAIFVVAGQKNRQVAFVVLIPTFTHLLINNLNVNSLPALDCV